MLLSVGFEQEIEHIIQISFLLFIYLDWVGRIWTPLRLNLVSNEKTFDKILILLKSIIEVGIVFCLVQSFFVYFIEKNAHQSFTLFGIFLLLSSIWNAIVISRSKIKLFGFLYKCFFGNVTHDNEIKYYIAPYTKKINQLKEEYDEEAKNAKIMLLNVVKLSLKSVHILVRKFIIEIIAQIAALHLIVINFLIGVLFVLYPAHFFVRNIQDQTFAEYVAPLNTFISKIISSQYEAALFWVLIVIVIAIAVAIFLTIMLYLIMFLFSESNKFCFIMSLSLLLFFFFSYYSLDARKLILTMLIQQSLIIVFTRLFLNPDNEIKTEDHSGN